MVTLQVHMQCTGCALFWYNDQAQERWDHFLLENDILSTDSAQWISGMCTEAFMLKNYSIFMHVT